MSKGLLEARSQEARSLEEALAGHTADRSQNGAASAIREQELARGQADARKALICLREELTGAQGALQEEHTRCMRLQSNQAAAQQVSSDRRLFRPHSPRTAAITRCATAACSLVMLQLSKYHFNERTWLVHATMVSKSSEQSARAC